MGAHTGSLHHLLEKVSRRPSIGPHNIYPRPTQISLSPSSPSRSDLQTPPPCQEPTDTPILPKSLPWSAPARGSSRRDREGTGSQKGRVCSLSAAAHPGDPERHGFLFTRQQLSGEKQKTRPPRSRGPESNPDQQPFLRSTPGDAGPASDLNSAPLPPYWPVRGTRSLPIGGCRFPRECVSRAIPRRSSRGGGTRARLRLPLVWLRACAA